MSLVPIDNVGQVGIIKDTPPYNIPPNAWSDGNNVRFLDNGVKKCAGYQEVMESCPFSPIYITPYLSIGGFYYWIAFGKEKIAALKDGAWTDITRQTTNTLNGAITDVATTITLTDASDFPTSGKIAIGSKQYGSGNDNYYEEIPYSGKSSNDLTGCTRGADKVAHDDGATVTPIDTTYTTDNAYSANTTTARWVVTDLNGVVVATNGVDAPQMWPLSTTGEPAVTVPFRELQNFPASEAKLAGRSGGSCDSIRSFRTFLVGLNWNNPEDRAEEEPRLVKWSTEASYYSLPSTWSASDATLDAGEYELADTPGNIIDGMAFGDSFFIYKDASIYIMNYVGTPYIFSFKLLSPTIGLLAKGAIAEFESGHFFMGNSDFYWNNGQTIKPMLSNKMRRTIYDELNGDNYQKCFVAADYIRNEMLACYPAGSSTVVNKALIWNWVENTFSLRDLPDVSHISSGILEITTGSKWSAQATLNDASFTSVTPANGGNVTVDTTVAVPVFTSTGTLIINDEQIAYTGTTGTTFSGITRGYGGSTPAAHDDDSVVNQYTATWDVSSDVWGATNYDNVVKNMVFVKPGEVATITGATAADPVVITATAHGLSNDDTVMIDYVVGMTQLNGNTYTVAGATADTFQLSGVDGSAYTAYSSGGNVIQHRIYRDNKGNKNDTQTMTAYIERTGHDLGDPSVVKFVSAVYPKLEVSGNNTLNVYVGRQMSTEEAITWEGPILFNPNSQSKVSCRVSGKYFGLKVESTTDVDWKLHGVAFEVAPAGKRGGRAY
jgi:hypothetical protein|tara:strand:+ start:676 stop:3006 length:2331 start_codon:yes stop_codon:yes gene_type:complete